MSLGVVPPLPVETLDQIVYSAFLALKPRRRCPSFAPLAGFSLACKQYRAIVLRRWFLTRSAVPIEDWRDWDMVRTLGVWIREISCTDSGVRLCNRLPLPPLVHLRAVQLDFNNHTPFKFRSAYNQTLNSFPHILTSLTLSSLPIINKSLLQSIASRFVQLTDLRLSTVERLVADESCCCSFCPRSGERQRLLSVQHSPVPVAFTDAQQLGVRADQNNTSCNLTVDYLQQAFGAYLAPLTALKTLHLGIYLSPEHALSEHGEHDGEQDLDSAGATSNPLARLADCPECCENHAESTRLSEEDASLALSANLQSLETVEWASCFIMMKCLWDEEEISESWGTTKLGVTRNGMEIKVKRIPEIIYGYEWNYSPQ